MMYEGTIKLMQRLLDITRQGRLKWKKNDDDWFSTSVDSRVICFRWLYVEATNQLGSDPRFLEFSMPGVNRCFAVGTEGADLLIELLGATNLGFQTDTDIEYGLQAAHSLLNQV